MKIFSYEKSTFEHCLVSLMCQSWITAEDAVIETRHRFGGPLWKTAEFRRPAHFKRRFWRKTSHCACAKLFSPPPTRGKEGEGGHSLSNSTLTHYNEQMSNAKKTSFKQYFHLVDLAEKLQTKRLWEKNSLAEKSSLVWPATKTQAESMRLVDHLLASC